jgi:rhomboid protease GluP
LQSLHQQLVEKSPKIWVTGLIIAINLLVFLAMLFNGAGLWHSSNGVQLAWGANFGPATQDAEWWRLGSAMFLHFGLVHLALNTWSLWDVGQLAERMYGWWRFLCIYLLSGLVGNLVSLVVQGNSAVSGGASGAIFGVYGAALVFLWRERAAIVPYEFRWLFWGALGFAILTIVFGLIIPGIDNAAHIGGFLTGILASIVFSQTITARVMPPKITLAAAFVIALASVVLFFKIPEPKYRWSDELLLRDNINAFVYEDQAINRSWLEIVNESKQGKKTNAELAGQIESTISEPLQQSFEQLSKLPQSQALPSAAQIAHLKQYTEQRKAASEALVKKLQSQQK